ncbi:paramyosin-like isoform X4 [Osmia bicornis bicornis]|uniref:paramyosin-like isoform X4 n=1 Tax=Osmia bicornis bicornis TaxID=1437191 RepID=UPI0010F98B69|nr:paramyosin-like isoform X4 [Osmia bicornis bicornis]
MDVQTGLVYVAVVVISAAVIVLVSMFGIKEKSYEEAIAEQRKLPDDLLFSKKEKNKEKKHKNKTGKKVKEKKEEKEEKEDKEEKPEHIQFEENPQILPLEPLLRGGSKGSKKKSKVEKIKPILVNKDEPLVIVTELSSSQPLSIEANHFDLIQPKDDLELVRSHSKENLHQIGQSEPVANKSPKETPTKSKKSVKEKDAKKKDENVKEEKKEATASINGQSVNKDSIKETKDVKEQKETPVKEVKEVVKETIVLSAQLPAKESKKSKKKNDILAQIGGDRDAVNVSLLMPLVQKAELSRSEIQILIDQLLNKQMDNPSEHSEWTEGRADPVIKLKKQLAEKEKALADEHEANIAFQNKLKELRAELNSERSRLSANVRQLEEALNAKVTETQTLHTRMQHILESHAAEKQGFTRQIEQLQTKVNENAAIIHKMQEDQGQTQGHLQQELITQRKNMEIQFAQMRENENALKAQLAQKHVDVQNLQSELQETCENTTGEIDLLQQQLGLMQNQLMHSEGQLQHFKDSDDRLQDMARQLEESHRAHADLDHRLKNAHRHEQELQKQVNSLQSELNAVKSEANNVAALKAELSKAQSDLMKLKSELSVSMNEAKSEAAEITALKMTLVNKEDELKKSEEKLNNIRVEFNQTTENTAKLEAQLHATQKKLDTLKVEFEKAIENLKKAQEKANTYKSDVQKLQEELKQKEIELEKSRAELRIANEATNEIKMLKAEINRLQCNDKKLSETQLQITRLQEENDKLSIQLSTFTDLQKQLKQLQEENESLASQLAATTERPAAEGRENGIDDNVQKNVQLVEQTNLLAQKESQLDALKKELTHKETELSQLTAQVDALRSDVNNQRRLAVRLNDDLEAQKSKNNEVTKKVKSQQEEFTKALLQRIFPEIKVSEKSYDQWLKVFEERVNTVLIDLKKKNVVDTPSELEKQNKNLQDLVSHYKQIIDDTEGMLNKLQSHVESEETRWESQLRQKENEVASLRLELNELMNKLNINEKLQAKIVELETRLKEAESFKEQTNTQLLALRSAPPLFPNEINTPDLAALEKLQEEKARLSEELQIECNKRAAVDAELDKLRSVVTQLHQKMSQIKSEVRGNCSNPEQSVLNGPPTSECSNSEFQEIDNSPFTTKHSFKSCHMTDHNTQPSWNPLMSQQHKKHKKKKKSTKKPMAKGRRFAGWFRKKITSKSKLR